MNNNLPDNWDADHRDIFNNSGKSSPVIIHAECRIIRHEKLIYYDCVSGTVCNSPFKITIHNYNSEALGFDPTIKSANNYYRFLHLSTLMHMPWGLGVKFKDNDGVVFGAVDVVRLLGERTDNAMEKWKESQVEFEKKQGKTLDKLKEECNSIGSSNNDDDTMEI